MYSEPHAGYQEVSGPLGASSPEQRGEAEASPHPGERYHEGCIQLPAGKDAELVFLRGVIDEGESRGWKLISAVKQPGDDVLLVTWDTSGTLSG